MLYVRYFNENDEIQVNHEEDSEFLQWLNVVLDEYDKSELIDMAG